MGGRRRKSEKDKGHVVDQSIARQRQDKVKDLGRIIKVLVLVVQPKIRPEETRLDKARLD